MIVVVDTNVWISALVFSKPGSVPRRVLDRVVREDKLAMDIAVRFVAQVVLVQLFHAPFEKQRDEQAAGDGEEVQQEVLDAMHAIVRRMNVEHRSLSYLSDRASAVRLGFVA